MSTFDLTNSRKIGDGEVRICYEHPSDPNLCIKIIKPQSWKSLPKHSLGNIVRKLLFPIFGLANPNKKELIAYTRIKRKSSTALSFIPTIHNIEDTSLGPGLVTTRIPYTQTIYDIVNSGKTLEDTDQALITNMIHTFLREKIYLFDLNLKNIAFIGEGDKRKVMVMDIKDYLSPKGIFPLEKYFPRLAKEKMLRRSNRLFQRIGIDDDTALDKEL